jgi:hypothetical protein
MHDMKCGKCGAEAPAGTSFCRQCGELIDTDSTQLASEQTTALLDQPDGVTTQRLESRATGPDRGRLPQPAVAKSTSSRRAMLIGALVIVVIGVLSVAALVGLRGHNTTSSDLLYPGAKTVVDMTGEGGGRTLHLETSDAFDAVEAWYQKALKPRKTVRLTSTSVVLKNNKTTATIASEDNKTNILIKVAP